MSKQQPTKLALPGIFSRAQTPATTSSGALMVRASGGSLTTTRVTFPASAATQPSRFDTPDTGKIALVIDATASREEGWDNKRRAHITLIEEAIRFSARFALRLLVHNGSGIGDSGWTRETSVLHRIIERQKTKSAATKIIPSLTRLLDEPHGALPSAVILVGDCCEETSFGIVAIANRLKAAGIAVFTFQEGNDPGAKEAFSLLATITGGACAAFGDCIDLSAFCKAIERFVTGGREGLVALSSSGDIAAAKLLTQMSPQGNGSALPFHQPKRE